MNRIVAHFESARREGRKSLVLFTTAGFPSMERTETIVEAIERGGCDVLELGVPFSDPIADGPTIQASSKEALDAGATLNGILELVERLRRRGVAMPILLFGAYNPFLHYGLEPLAQRAKAVGVDGFLVPDVPIEESTEFEGVCAGASLALVQLTAPTTPPDRLRRIAARSAGFLYYISMTGVTGGALHVDDRLRARIAAVREAAGDLTVAVGFGVSSPEDAAKLAEVAEAVVIGSALVRLIDRERDAEDLSAKIEAYVRSLKAVLP